MSQINKARFWVGVLYQENMIDYWQDKIGDIVQVPFCYCCHTRDKDLKSDHRKDHLHLILSFPNTTTYKHALEVFDLLSAPHKKALNTIQAVINIRNVYDYLIHDTEACKKANKEIYRPEERICGNCFDIGAYEQLSVAEKNEMFLMLGEVIRNNGFTNYIDFYEFVVDSFDNINFVDIMRSYSSHFERLCKGNYQRYLRNPEAFEAKISSKSVSQTHLDTLSDTLETHLDTQVCCPECGSLELKKNGKTLVGTTRWRCKDCGKSFTL